MNKKKLKRIILSLFIFLFVVGINYYLIKDVYCKRQIISKK